MTIDFNKGIIFLKKSKTKIEDKMKNSGSQMKYSEESLPNRLEGGSAHNMTIAYTSHEVVSWSAVLGFL